MSIVLPVIILLNLALGIWLSGQFGLGPRGSKELLTALGTFGSPHVKPDQKSHGAGSNDRSG